MQIAPAASGLYSRRPGPAAAPPFTHHEIIRLIAPFTRRGRHADLAASDRSERRLVFKPITHPDPTAALDGLCETLQLDNPRPDQHRLIRTLISRDGLAATLQIEGTDPAALLAAIETVTPQRQFPMIAGHVIAQSHRLDMTYDQTPELVLTSAQARIGGVTLTLAAETGKGYPAEITLTPATNRSLGLPDDILAVLGWDWTVLRLRNSASSAALKARGREPKRSRVLESKFARTVAHLAKTLAEPPHVFHERLKAARWMVVFRRSIPLLFCIGLIAGTIGLTFLNIPTDSMVQMLVFNLPPLLLMMLFGMREVPRLEIPPMPRASAAAAWLPDTKGN